MYKNLLAFPRKIFGLLVLLMLTAIPLQAMDLKLDDGRVLKGAEVGSVSGVSIAINHDEGVSNVQPEDLSEEGRNALKKTIRKYWQRHLAHTKKMIKNPPLRNGIDYLEKQIERHPDAPTIAELKSLLAPMKQAADDKLAEARTQAETENDLRKRVAILEAAIAQNGYASAPLLSDLNQKKNDCAIAVATEDIAAAMTEAKGADNICHSVAILEKAVAANPTAGNIAEAKEYLGSLLQKNDELAIGRAVLEAEKQKNPDAAIKILKNAIAKNRSAANVQLARKAIAQKNKEKKAAAQAHEITQLMKELSKILPSQPEDSELSAPKKPGQKTAKSQKRKSGQKTAQRPAKPRRPELSEGEKEMFAQRIKRLENVIKKAPLATNIVEAKKFLWQKKAQYLQEGTRLPQLLETARAALAKDKTDSLSDIEKSLRQALNLCGYEFTAEEKTTFKEAATLAQMLNDIHSCQEKVVQRLGVWHTERLRAELAETKKKGAGRSCGNNSYMLYTDLASSLEYNPHADAQVRTETKTFLQNSGYYKWKREHTERCPKCKGAGYIHREGWSEDTTFAAVGAFKGFGPRYYNYDERCATCHGEGTILNPRL